MENGTPFVPLSPHASVSTKVALGDLQQEKKQNHPTKAAAQTHPFEIGHSLGQPAFPTERRGVKTQNAAAGFGGQSKPRILEREALMFEGGQQVVKTRPLRARRMRWR